MNKKCMEQPLSAAEYEEYNDKENYIGKPIQNNQQEGDGFWQAVLDGVNHTAQGVSLGFSDEACGVLGGVGRVLANGIMRAAGQNVNG